MKKLLSIILGIIILSSFSVVAFAADEAASSTDNYVCFSSETTYVKAGRCYEIPIYLDSDYTTDSKGDTLVGLNFYLSGEAYDSGYVSLTKIKVSEDVQCMPGYEQIALTVCHLDDPMINTMIFRVSGKELLHKKKLHIATVTIEVSDEYTGDPLCNLIIKPAKYLLHSNRYTWYARAPIEIWSEYNGDETRPVEAIHFGGDEHVEVFTDCGLITAAPKPFSCFEAVRLWLADLFNSFIVFFEKLPDLISGS